MLPGVPIAIFLVMTLCCGVYLGYMTHTRLIRSGYLHIAFANDGCTLHGKKGRRLSNYISAITTAASLFTEAVSCLT